MTTMKVANFYRGSEATGEHFSRAYKPEPVFSFFSYLKRRSRTRAVVPEKSTPPMLENTNPMVHDEDQKSSMAFQQDQETPIFVSESEFESFVIEHETAGKQLTIEKILANGDFYSGHYKGNAPEGVGKYLWSDGCMYEGQWGAGKTTGRGKISWPSGATYEGDCMRGCLQGHGTFTAIDGATYKGNWNLNLRHGFGEKRYTNNDLYEGFWKDGMQDGSGRYVWANGNEYVGDWKAGIMSGKGTLTWACGDRYEGEWHEGLEHGNGIYTWSDGACYIGSWKKGLKDGKGIFYPAGCLPPRAKPSKETTELDNEEKDPGLSSEMERRIHCRSRSFSSADDFCDGTPHRSQWVASLEDGYVSTSAISGQEQSFERRWSLEGSVEKHINIYRKQLELECYRKGLFGNMDPIETPVMEREYIQGVLINEIVKHSMPVFPRKGTRRRQRRQSKEIKRPGETVIKGHRSYDLMMNLQLGIRYSVGKVTQESKQDIGPLHFGPRAVLQIRFPKSGSQLTPPHQSFDFKWKDFCPAVFRSLREMFKIDAADYMLSICGSAALRELSSPGKSGSVFYLSHDDRFIIKTMRKAEVKVLLEMLPSYYQHVKMYESTLVTKFFGLHQVEPYGGGRKVRFVVMGNMFCTDLKIHRRFDLKGSSQGRSTDKVEIDENTTFKDLDLNFVFHLEPSWRKAMLRQLECDCKFLEAQRIMDYSLLLGIHFRAPEYPAVFSPVPLRSNDLLADGIQTSLPDIESFLADVTADDLAGKLLSVTGPRRHVRESSIGAKYENGVLTVPGATRLKIRLGVNMPARADRRLLIEKYSAAQENHPGDVYDVVLYFGVIDILQQYDMTKKVEHAYKSLQFDAQSISAVDPKLYSQRFQDLVRRVFPASDCS